MTGSPADGLGWDAEAVELQSEGFASLLASSCLCARLLQRGTKKGPPQWGGPFSLLFGGPASIEMDG